MRGFCHRRARSGGAEQRLGSGDAKGCWKVAAVMGGGRGAGLPVSGKSGLRGCFNSLDRHGAARLAMTWDGLVAMIESSDFGSAGIA